MRHMAHLRRTFSPCRALQGFPLLDRDVLEELLHVGAGHYHQACQKAAAQVGSAEHLSVAQVR